MKSLKRIATLTIKEAIKNSPHNLNKKNLIKKIQIKKSQMKQNLIKFCFFFLPWERLEKYKKIEKVETTNEIIKGETSGEF